MDKRDREVRNAGLGLLGGFAVTVGLIWMLPTALKRILVRSLTETLKLLVSAVTVGLITGGISELVSRDRTVRRLEVDHADEPVPKS